MHRSLPCSKEMLEFIMLHEVVPKLCCNDLLVLRKNSCDGEPACDDMPVL
jgi:hypothetical protein